MDSPFSDFSSCFPSTQITPEPAVTLSSSGLKPAVSSLISRLSSVSLTLSSCASLRLILEEGVIKERVSEVHGNHRSCLL